MLKFGYIYYILPNTKLPRIRKALDLANHDSKVYIGECILNSNAVFLKRQWF